MKDEFELNYDEEYITIEQKFGDIILKCTQRYNIQFNFGHYIIVAEDKHGNILNVIQTTCGVPNGKINEGTLIKYYNRHFK